MGEVLQFPRSRQQVPANVRCSCGDEWWIGGAVVFAAEGPVVGHTVVSWVCASCGKAKP